MMAPTEGRHRLDSGVLAFRQCRSSFVSGPLSGKEDERQKTSDEGRPAKLVRVSIGDELLLMTPSQYAVFCGCGDFRSGGFVPPAGEMQDDHRARLDATGHTDHALTGAVTGVGPRGLGVARAGLPAGGGIVATWCVCLALLWAVLLLSGCGTVREVRSANAEVRSVAEGVIGQGPMLQGAAEPIGLMVTIGALVALAGLLTFWVHKRAGLCIVLSGGATVLLGYVLPALAPYALAGAFVGVGMIAGYYVGRRNLITGEDSIDEILRERSRRDPQGIPF